jgi:hypothetical protein
VHHDGDLGAAGRGRLDYIVSHRHRGPQALLQAELETPLSSLNVSGVR